MVVMVVGYMSGSREGGGGGGWRSCLSVSVVVVVTGRRSWWKKRDIILECYWSSGKSYDLGACQFRQRDL